MTHGCRKCPTVRLLQILLPRCICSYNLVARGNFTVRYIIFLQQFRIMLYVIWLDIMVLRPSNTDCLRRLVQVLGNGFLYWMLLR